MVRKARSEDFEKIVRLHISCFPNSFSTAFGKANNGKLLQKYYKNYFLNVPELFLVCEDKEEIVGLCMGYYCEDNNYMKKYVKENILSMGFRVFLLLLTGNKLAWRKVKNVFHSKDSVELLTNEFESIPAKQRGDLLSICVLPEYRGHGAAQELLDCYIDTLRQNGRKLCLLTVETSNARGIRFYEKNGFVPYKKVGENAMAYAKML